jgi:hypothetical protein
MEFKRAENTPRSDAAKIILGRKQVTSFAELSEARAFTSNLFISKKQTLAIAL